jgi:hypothetical protein
MWRKIPPFSFSVGERKIMNHFVVNPVFLISLAAAPSCDICGERIHGDTPRLPIRKPVKPEKRHLHPAPNGAMTLARLSADYLSVRKGVAYGDFSKPSGGDTAVGFA